MCLYGYNNKHFTTAGVLQCVGSCVWCWWSVLLPQSFLPCIAMLLSLDQWAWKEAGTFGICAVLCKISNRTSLLLIQYKYLFIPKQMPVSGNVCMSEEQGRGILVATIVDLEALGSVLTLYTNTSQIDLDFCISPFISQIIFIYIN